LLWYAGGVRADSRWSSASRDAGVVAKNVTARTPPETARTKTAPRQGCQAFLDSSHLILHPCRDASFAVIRSGGFRAASFFAMTPSGPEALDHRLFSSTPPAKAGAPRFRSQSSSAPRRPSPGGRGCPVRTFTCTPIAPVLMVSPIVATD